MEADQKEFQLRTIMLQKLDAVNSAREKLEGFTEKALDAQSIASFTNAIEEHEQATADWRKCLETKE